MKLELIVFSITGFLIYNTYHDGAYVKILKGYMKYYKMAMIGFVGFSLYLLMKKDPNGSKDFIQCAGNLIKRMPIDKSTGAIFTPFFDMQQQPTSDTPQMKRMKRSGTVSGGKRCVSETKKKYVASQQDWKCKHCTQTLDATFEVDHVLDLQYGGSNNVDNLVALCRNCHGKKTMLNHL